MLHWMKGTPFQLAEDQGRYDSDTFWEQIDHGRQGTVNRRIFTTVPLVLSEDNTRTGGGVVLGRNEDWIAAACRASTGLSSCSPIALGFAAAPSRLYLCVLQFPPCIVREPLGDEHDHHQPGVPVRRRRSQTRLHAPRAHRRSQPGLTHTHDWCGLNKQSRTACPKRFCPPSPPAATCVHTFTQRLARSGALFSLPPRAPHSAHHNVAAGHSCLALRASSPGSLLSPVSLHFLILYTTTQIFHLKNTIKADQAQKFV